MIQRLQAKVMHLDDERSWRGQLQKPLNQAGFMYTGFECLSGLRMVLKQAKDALFVIDGTFPLERNGSLGFHVPEAIHCIRNVCGNDAKILVWSGESSHILQKLEQEMGVASLRKQNASPRLLVGKLRAEALQKK